MAIPARFAIGFALPAERGRGKIAGYHSWAEFYAKGIGWVPIDASEAAKNPAKRENFFGRTTGTGWSLRGGGIWR